MLSMNRLRNWSLSLHRQIQWPFPKTTYGTVERHPQLETTYYDPDGASFIIYDGFTTFGREAFRPATLLEMSLKCHI